MHLNRPRIIFLCFCCLRVFGKTSKKLYCISGESRFCRKRVGQLQWTSCMILIPSLFLDFAVFAARIPCIASVLHFCPDPSKTQQKMKEDLISTTIYQLPIRPPASKEMKLTKRENLRKRESASERKKDSTVPLHTKDKWGRSINSWYHKEVALTTNRDRPA